MSDWEELSTGGSEWSVVDAPAAARASGPGSDWDDVSGGPPPNDAVTVDDASLMGGAGGGGGGGGYDSGVDLSMLRLETDTASELTDFDFDRLSEFDDVRSLASHQTHVSLAASTAGAPASDPGPTFWDNDGNGNELDAMDDAMSVNSVNTAAGWPRVHAAQAPGAVAAPLAMSFKQALIAGGGGIDGQRARELARTPMRTKRNAIRMRFAADPAEREAAARAKRVAKADEHEENDETAMLEADYLFRKYVVPSSIKMRLQRVRFRGPRVRPPLQAPKLSAIDEMYGDASDGEDELVCW